MRIGKFRLITAILITVTAHSCSKSPSSQPPSPAPPTQPTSPQLSVAPEIVAFPDRDSSLVVNVSSNVTWTVSDNQGWITTSSASGGNNGSFVLSVTRNTDTIERSGTVTITGGGLSKVVAVKQAAYPNNDGVTLMRGTSGVSLYYLKDSQGNPTDFLSADGYSSAVRMTFDLSTVVRTKLVNAQLGVMTATPRLTTFQYTHYEVDFSNVNHYTSDAQVANPDTAGKIQIWIYREDGKNIIPANGNRRPVKTIIQMPGRFPSGLDNFGIIRLLDYDHAGYPFHPPPITTVQSLSDIFSNARWRFNLSQFTWPSW